MTKIVQLYVRLQAKSKIQNCEDQTKDQAMEKYFKKLQLLPRAYIKLHIFTLLLLPDLWIVSQISHRVGTSLVIIGNDDYDNDDYDDDDVPDRVAADNDDHNVDAHSGDQNLALSDQFLQERIWFCIKSGFTGTIVLKR